MEQVVNVTVNGETCERSVPVRMLLVDFLRDEMRLTGTHVGCTYEGRCGACTVTVDGEAMKSCMMLAVQADDRAVMTVEGLEGLSQDEAKLHPIQESFWDHHGLQCGYCTPGMMMTIFDLLRAHDYSTEARLTDAEIRHEIIGNICRCTGYENIVRAVMAAEETLRSMSPSDRDAVLVRATRGGGQA